MKYKIEYAKVYGKDTAYKPETAITKGMAFSLVEVREQLDLMQRYSKSLKYKFVVDNLGNKSNKVLCDATVKRVRQMRKLGLSYRKISERIGCNIYTVHDTINNW